MQKAIKVEGPSFHLKAVHSLKGKEELENEKDGRSHKPYSCLLWRKHYKNWSFIKISLGPML